MPVPFLATWETTGFCKIQLWSLSCGSGNPCASHGSGPFPILPIAHSCLHQLSVMPHFHRVFFCLVSSDVALCCDFTNSRHSAFSPPLQHALVPQSSPPSFRASAFRGRGSLLRVHLPCVPGHWVKDRGLNHGRTLLLHSYLNVLILSYVEYNIPPW